MNPIAAFGIEFLLTVLVGALLIVYIRQPLFHILLDLCGTADRARFWLAFSTLLLAGFPTAITLGFQPDQGDITPTFFLLVRQLGLNIVGFLAALVILGLMISLFALFTPKLPKERVS